MWAKGCDEYRGDFGVNERTTGGKRVRRGTSRGRDAQAIRLDRS